MLPTRRERIRCQPAAPPRGPQPDRRPLQVAAEPAARTAAEPEGDVVDGDDRDAAASTADCSGCPPSRRPGPSPMTSASNGHPRPAAAPLPALHLPPDTSRPTPLNRSASRTATLRLRDAAATTSSAIPLGRADASGPDGSWGSPGVWTVTVRLTSAWPDPAGLDAQSFKNGRAASVAPSRAGGRAASCARGGETICRAA